MTTTTVWPAVRDAPPAPDLTGAHCANDPLSFDLDALKHDPVLANLAARRCVRDCPVFTACATWTQGLMKKRTTTPSGVVQAGLIFGMNTTRSRPEAAKWVSLADLPKNIRDAHTQFTQLSKAGIPRTDMPDHIVEGERTYQAVSKRDRKMAKAAR